MVFLETTRQRALLLILLLGAALVIALAPFATGLIGIPVLYVIFHPVHEKFARRLGDRASALVVIALALVLVVFPAVAFIAMLVAQAQELATGLADSPLFRRLGALNVAGFAVGPYLSDIGSRAATWLGGSALGLLGTATRVALNLLVALFGLYYLLLRPDHVWSTFRGYLPFTGETTERLKKRFRGVTAATVIGSGLAALIQGVMVGLAFWLADLPNVLFWSMVTMVLAILPVVGSALVWGPAALVLAANQRYLAAGLMVGWGLVLGNIDYVIRPMAGKRWAHIHPATTLVGALAGVPYFGLLGLLIGPLALSYFFELAAIYREEYDKPGIGNGESALGVGM